MLQSLALDLVADRLTVTEPGPAPDLKLFQSIPLPRLNIWRSFILSAVLHSACILGLPALMDLLPESDAEAWQRHMRAMRPIQIRIPDRLYLSSTEPEPPKPPGPQVKPKRVSVSQETAKAEVPLPEPSKAEPLRVPPRPFKLPESVRRVDVQQTLIQPHLPPDLPLTAQVRLPQLILLSRSVLPRPAPRRFVEPGRSPAPVMAPRVDAPPQLASPSDANPDLRIASMLAGPENARLRLPRPTAPVRQFQAPAPLPSGSGASLSPILGELIDILAISGNPAPLQERVVIPLGNQVERLPSLPVYSDKASLRPGDTSSKKTGGGAASSPAKSGSGDPWKDFAREGEMSELAQALASLPLRYSTPIRIEHPVNAVYDVVVTQSSADQAFTESAGVLTGQPVYTVYLQVGAPRAWILQYCVPQEVAEAPKVIGGAVNIGSPAPALKAPFPLVTVLPPATMLPRTSYIIVHGFVDTSGELKDLAVMRAPNEKIRELVLPELSQWQFRPAVRNGAPVAVEIILAIPPQQG